MFTVSPQTNRSPSLALFLLALSQFTLALDYTIVFVALPTIASSLGFSANTLQWVVSAYALIYGGLLLIGGKLSDVFGQRRMFIVAMMLFGLGSLLGGLAHSQVLLILARGLQGLGGALLTPATLSLILSTFAEGEPRTRALGLLAAMGGVGLSAGLLLGGLLTSYAGWPYIFLVNVPIAVLSVLLAPRALADDTVSAASRQPDVMGALSVTLGLILVVYYLVQAPVTGWLNAGTLLPGLLGAALLALFVWLEGWVREPLLPLRLLRSPTLVGATLTAALFSASFGTLYYFLTLFAQQVLGYSAIQTGLAFLPLTLAALLGSRLIGPVLGRLGVAGTLAVGMALGAAGFLLLTRLSLASSVWAIVLPTLIIGLGQAMVFTTMYVAGSAGIRPEVQGVASALISTGQQVGSALGLAVVIAVISSGLTGRLENLSAVRLSQVLNTAFLLEAVVAVLAVGVVWLTLRQRRSTGTSAGLS
jgi:EmrB/QacA subfamily drug resistance transporter